MDWDQVIHVQFPEEKLVAIDESSKKLAQQLAEFEKTAAAGCLSISELLQLSEEHAMLLRSVNDLLMEEFENGLAQLGKAYKMAAEMGATKTITLDPRIVGANEVCRRCFEVIERGLQAIEAHAGRA